jgi:hypothetical protein
MVIAILFPISNSTLVSSIFTHNLFRAIIKNIKLYDDINFNNAILIIDCALSNKSTILERLANKYSLNYISGNDFYKLQRNFQKKIYLNGGL